MPREVVSDNKSMMANLREAGRIAEDGGDIETASMLEILVDGAKKRNWFLFEAGRNADQTGH